MDKENKKILLQTFWANHLMLALAELIRDVFIFSSSIISLIHTSFWGFALSTALIIFSYMASVGPIKYQIQATVAELNEKDFSEKQPRAWGKCFTWAAMVVLIFSFWRSFLC
ncbi:MAG: hypothetical protein ACI37O_02455 [Candidatus Avelusimicrobium sp.]|uniref:hypothetical protein n=1 Tax=Candidatus Avelusimicrobium sp. TaxID=3048833 RepID=UPI003EFF8452